MEILIGQQLYFRNDYGGPLLYGVIDRIDQSKALYKYSVLWDDGIRNNYTDSEILSFIQRYDPYVIDFFDKIKDRLL